MEGPGRGAPGTFRFEMASVALSFCLTAVAGRRCRKSLQGREMAFFEPYPFRARNQKSAKISTSRNAVKAHHSGGFEITVGAILVIARLVLPGFRRVNTRFTPTALLTQAMCGP